MMECNNKHCHNEAYPRKGDKFPSKRYYCTPCKRYKWKIRLDCPFCNKEFTPSSLTQRYCCLECTIHWRDNNPKPITQLERVIINKYLKIKQMMETNGNKNCVVCNNDVNDTLYCSQKCSVRLFNLRKRQDVVL